MSAMAYTKIPENTFETLAINAGVLLSSYTPGTPPDDEDIIGPTTGGISFQATPSFKDLGEDIDNCPKNTKELKRLEDWDIKMSGTFIAATPAIAQMLIGLADIDSTDTSKVTPRDTIDIENDFRDIWLVCDYGDVNTGNAPGHVAIHMMNAMSTGGFQIQTTDKEKNKFSFEFTAHYSIDAQDTVPFEVYIKKGTDSNATPEILLNKHSVTLAVNGTYQLNALRLVPAGSTITYSSGTTAKATVSSAGLVTAVAAGSSVITASITVDGVTYTDTCTVVVAST